MSAVLEIKQLSIKIGKSNAKPVVNGVNLSILPGQCVGLVGESGSGKSMTALAILQLLPDNALVDSRSQIFFKDEDILTYTEQEMRRLRGKRIGIIFQDAMSAFNPVLTIGQQLIDALPAHQYASRKQQKMAAILLLTEVGISEAERCLQAYAHELSGGMRQRAMIAMTLAGEPELLIADEPTTALDVTLQAQIIQLLKRLQQQRNMAMLFISHHLLLVAQLADYLVVLQHGKVVEHAPAQQFFHQPQQSYSIKLLNAMLPMQASLPSVAANKSILQVHNLHVAFAIRKGLFQRTVAVVKAVNNVDLTLRQGETLALVGESGCGKTTIGKALMRLLPHVSGTVDYAGKNLLTLSTKNMRKIRGKLQMIFQDPFAALNPRMLIVDSILEGMLTQRLVPSYKQGLLRVDTLLEQVGLSTQVKWRYPHEFSGGERQRICIARALAMSPQIVILDEPTSALDVTIQKQILDLLLELQQNLQLSYLLITHDMSVVAYMAHRVAVMHHGRIVEQGGVASVLQQPQDSYTQQLLAAIPSWP